MDAEEALEDEDEEEEFINHTLPLTPLRLQKRFRRRRHVGYRWKRTPELTRGLTRPNHGSSENYLRDLKHMCLRISTSDHWRLCDITARNHETRKRALQSRQLLLMQCSVCNVDCSAVRVWTPCVCVCGVRLFLSLDTFERGCSCISRVFLQSLRMAYAKGFLKKLTQPYASAGFAYAQLK